MNNIMSVLQGLAGTWNSRFNELESKLINLTQVLVAESTRIQDIQDPTAVVQDSKPTAGDTGATRGSSLTPMLLARTPLAR